MTEDTRTIVGKINYVLSTCYDGKWHMLLKVDVVSEDNRYIRLEAKNKKLVLKALRCHYGQKRCIFTYEKTEYEGRLTSIEVLG